jgi:glycosyltransferase involved in cell wall biosynthesis
MDRPAFTVIVPCLNEEELIAECVAKVNAYFERTKTLHEIIIVDDGSTDRTLEISRALAAKDKRVSVLKQPRNFGVGKAINDGLEAAKGVWGFCQCADMPFDISDLDQVRPLMDEKTDVVVVARKDRSANSPFRKLTSLANYYLIRVLFGVPLEDYQFIQFYKTDSIRPLLPLSSHGSFAPPELLIKAWKAGLKFQKHQLHFQARTAGEAKYGSPRRLIQSIAEIVKYRMRTL